MDRWINDDKVALLLNLQRRRVLWYCLVIENEILIFDCDEEDDILAADAKQWI